MKALYFIEIFFFNYFVNAEDILGCGGFVKAGVEIEFNRILVQLFTSTGSLKYETDCAPNNGYYFFPLYENGEYVIKIKPPLGWSVKPDEIKINVDGKSDACSLGQDINFEFTGFGIIGAVNNKEGNDGPKGVTIQLRESDSKNLIQFVSTQDKGEFIIRDVPPGKYDVVASHEKWQFNSEKATVDVKNDISMAKGLQIAGYDVSGSVRASKQPISGVTFILYGSNSISNLKGCILGGGQAPVQKNLGTVICHVMSDNDGNFVFPVVPAGKYHVVPFYQGEFIRFDVSPANVAILVDNGSLIINEIFYVEGFSVSGKVFSGETKVPVGGASIYINGQDKAVAISNDLGVYTLDKLEAGQYKLSVKLQKYIFPQMSVKISPNSPVLPDIIAEEFEICGKVDIENLPKNLMHNSRNVYFRDFESDDLKKAIAVEHNGNFCVFLQAGTFRVSVEEKDDDKLNGVMFSPQFQKIIVVDSPMSQLFFSPLKSKIIGEIKCISSPCTNFRIILHPINEGSLPEKSFTTTTNKFEIDSVSPADYKIEIAHKSWCWEETSIPLSVFSEVVNVTFKHTGFKLEVQSSHETQVNYVTNNGASGSFLVSKGYSSSCLTSPDTYTFKTKSCHEFNIENDKWNFLNPKAVILAAHKHLLSGSILSSAEINDLKVTFSSTKGTLTVPVKEPKKVNSSWNYTVSYMAAPGEEIDILPFSATLLFTPNRKVYKMRNDCDFGFNFQAKVGIFIKGEIIPPLQDVHIKLTSNNSKIIDLKTNKDGKYLVGPLNSDMKYTVEAEKEGFVFKKSDIEGNFYAKKLASIKVFVTDENNLPLPGVVISVSGGTNYRSNSQTKQDGTTSFNSLSPSNYYIRPVLKEYLFDPQSEMVSLSEGSEKKITIKSVKVAFSAYGMVLSLSGEAESDVVVEVKGLGNCSHLQEEAVTASDGSFRVRGLRPYSNYNLQLSNRLETNIDTSLPPYVAVSVVNSDIKGLLLKAIRRSNQIDVQVLINTKPEFLKSITLFMYCNANSQLKFKRKLTTKRIVILPPIPFSNQACKIVLHSNLNPKLYALEKIESEFVCNQSMVHIEFDFYPELKVYESELSGNSWMSFPIILAILLIFLNIDSVMPFLRSSYDSSSTYFINQINQRLLNSTKIMSTPAVSEQEIDSAVAFVNSSTKKKSKIKK